MSAPEEVRDPGEGVSALRFRKAFLLVLVVGISILFLLMVGRFLLAVFLAAILAGLFHPVFTWLAGKLGGHRGWAAILTLLLLVLGVILPLSGFLAVVASEAVQVSQQAEGWVQGQEGLLDRARGWVERIPLADRLLPDGEELLQQFRELAGRTGPALMGVAAAATRGTLNFLLQALVFLYAMYFFLVDGPAILRKILYYIPLSSGEELQLLERFVSVTRATLKGSLLIGVIQGGLAGVAFWVAGVPGSAFWGTVMVILSIIPAVGAALVWVPAVVYLFIAGQTAPAVGLLVWCGVVVSLTDNLLRPRLIGKDARMSDLMILLSTLGGIALFGAVGFVVGPIVAALFVTVWHIYGEAFDDWLPEVPEGPLLEGAKEGKGDEPEEED